MGTESPVRWPVGATGEGLGTDSRDPRMAGGLGIGVEGRGKVRLLGSGLGGSKGGLEIQGEDLRGCLGGRQCGGRGRMMSLTLINGIR